MKKFMTIAEYATFRKNRGMIGGSRVAVYKAINTGRITIESNGLIDTEKADAQWEQRTAFKLHWPSR